MGSVQNRIIETSLNNDNLTADAHFSFTPGVNGDYAYPEASYVHFNINDTSVFDTMDMDLEYTMTDSVEHEPLSGAQQANQTYTKLINIPHPQGLNMSEAVINGFDIQMKCLDKECNSNGIWPFDFKIAVHKVNETNDSTTFNFTHRINRAWTPSHGGGRALNQQMQFNVTMPLKFFFFNEDSGAVNKTLLQHSGSLTDKNDNPYYDIYPPVFPNDFNGSAMLTGINHLEFTLSNSKYGDRGRYFESMLFHLLSADFYDGDYQSGFIRYEMGIGSPRLTTYKSDIDYTMGLVSIAISKKAEPFVSEVQKVHGEVCIDDWETLMWCKSHKMKA